jgi:hypothetical protein
LNHTIVPSHDKETAARFFARIFRLSYDDPGGHFDPVQVNDSLTLDFDNRDQFERHPYAFHVSEEEFDQIFGRLELEPIRSKHAQIVHEEKKDNARTVEKSTSGHDYYPDASVKQ